jgi:hypothetical protein
LRSARWCFTAARRFNRLPGYDGGIRQDGRHGPKHWCCLYPGQILLCGGIPLSNLSLARGAVHLAHLILDHTPQVKGHFAKFGHYLAYRARKTGQLLGPEDNQSHNE